MKKKYIIFDFNGTLYNDLVTCLLTINQILVKRNLEPISLDHYKEIFTFPVSNYYQKAGLDLEKEEFADIAKEWVELYFKYEKQAKLFDDVLETLDYLKNSYELIILSATKQDILEKQLKDLKISNYFRYVIGIKDIYANSKINEALEFFNKTKISKEEVLYIGDTIHDKEVADELGVEIYLVTNGHNSVNILKKAKCKLIDNLACLKDLL